MQDNEFSAVIDLILKEDPRFDKRAYVFVRQGLDSTVRELRKKDPAKTQKSPHISGGELMQGLRVYALEQYGPLAQTVLASWGIRRCADFGDVVFNLIEYHVFSKSDGDRREDFAGGFSFEEAFVEPFLPKVRRPKDRAAQKTLESA